MAEATSVRFTCTYTVDVRKKQRKKWLDGILEVNLSQRAASLHPEDTAGETSSQPIARINRLPDDVCLRGGGGDAFVMHGGGDRGKEYLVQVDEVDEGGRTGHGTVKSVESVESVSKAFVMPQVIMGAGAQKQGAGGVLLPAGRGLGGGQAARCRTEAALPRVANGEGEGSMGGRKRRKRSTREILDLLGIEVKGYTERGENVDANVTNVTNMTDAVVGQAGPEKVADVPSSLEMQGAACCVPHQKPPETAAPAPAPASVWAVGMPVGKVIKPAIMAGSKTRRAPCRHACGDDGVLRDGMRVPYKLPQMHMAPPVPRNQLQAFDGSTLVCPTPQASIKPVRMVRIPTSFDTTWSYLDTMKRAVLEEAYLRIIDSTTGAFFGADGGGGREGGRDGNHTNKKMRMPFDHGRCTLKIWKNNHKNKTGAADEDKPESVYLILGSHTLKASEYHKSDVWLLSNDPGFGAGVCGVDGVVSSTERAVRTKASTWTCVVRSLWHGPNKDGKFEVEFVSKKPSFLVASTAVYALKGPDISIEMDLSETLLEGMLREGGAPIIPSLLSEVSGPDALMPSVEDLARDMPAYNEVADRFHLNKHQRKALANVAAWHVSPKARPVCLVHGPFGTGKSQLMVSILHLILKLRDTEGGLANARVMVSSHTNVAVDRVCLGLVESGVTSFLRVGALRKIDVDLLGHSLHASESNAHTSAVNELKDMAKTAQGRLLAKLKLQIAEVERGADRQRKKRLNTCPIVGVTCVSTSLDVLQGQQFDVLLLDEASQLTEPMSLAPIIRSKCKYLIAAGDPHQLSPVVCPPDHVHGDRVHSLLRPLFVRLVGLGHEPHLLKTQYRCHPDISDVCNRHFYDNRLEDGVCAEQRRSLIPSISHAVVVVDVQGQEQYKARSMYNDAEARAVGVLIRKLVQAGVSPGDIGVIAFYRAHVEALKWCVGAVASCGGGAGEVQVATVDSFQGAEKQIIILSTATTKASSFVSEPTRLNVALSRATNHLFLVTNQSLCRSVPSLDYVFRRSQAQGGYYLGGIHSL